MNHQNYHTSQNGRSKTSEELHIDVKDKLISLISKEIFEDHGHRIFFAICIHTIECWLLPVCYTDSHRTNINNCLDTLNRALDRQNKPVILPDAKNKSRGIRAYDFLLKDIKRKTDLIENSQYNFGFSKFIESLGTIPIDER